MASVSNLVIDQGTNVTITLTVTDETGTERNLTNHIARSQMRRSYYTTANTAFTASIDNPSTGEVVLGLTADQTSNLKPGRYVYDVELVNNSTGKVERITEGIVTVYPEVTR